MPIKHALSAFSGDYKDANLVKLFISKLKELEKLQNDKLQAKTLRKIKVFYNWPCNSILELHLTLTTHYIYMP
jgi:hypothetical protein